MQLLSNLAASMAVFVLLEELLTGRGGWKCALEECGEPCVMTVGAPLMLV